MNYTPSPADRIHDRPPVAALAEPSATAASEPLPPRRRWPAVSGPLVGLVAIVLLFVVIIPLVDPGGVARFLSFANLRVVVNQVTITAVLSLGMLLLVLSGGIDLSVGSVVALVTVATMLVYTAVFRVTESTALASLAAVPAGVLAGGVCGLCNGLIVTGLRLSPFVTTLGMMGVARGLALYLAGNRSLSFPDGGRPAWWVDPLTEVHPDATVFNPAFYLLVLLAVGMLLLLRRTVLGRHAFAIGSSEATALLCGVPVGRTKVVLYTLAGLLTGWAGILSFANIGGVPTSSQGMELEVIAAVVIGGASLTGGQGTVSGTLLGVLILGVLLNGVGILGMPSEYRYLLTGSVIILSTALGRLRSAERT